KNMVSSMSNEYIFPVYGNDSHGKSFKHVEVFGDSTYVGKRILLLGDSRGLTYKPYLDYIGKKYHYSFRAITNDIYPTIPHIADSIIKETLRRRIYHTLLPHITSEIAQADIILVYFAGQGTRWIDAITKTIADLKPNQKIIFISD